MLFFTEKNGGRSALGFGYSALKGEAGAVTQQKYSATELEWVLPFRQGD
jgi:hypothetical protein